MLRIFTCITYLRICKKVYVFLIHTVYKGIHSRKAYDVRVQWKREPYYPHSTRSSYKYGVSMYRTSSQTWEYIKYSMGVASLLTAVWRQITSLIILHCTSLTTGSALWRELLFIPYGKFLCAKTTGAFSSMIILIYSAIGVFRTWQIKTGKLLRDWTWRVGENLI